MSSLVRDKSTPPPPAVAEERSVTLEPRVDILETEHEFVVLADLPGVKPNDVDVRYERGELTVHGKRSAGPRSDALNYHRVFTVPESIASDKITAELKAGVLTIKLPKIEAAKPKRITVTG